MSATVHLGFEVGTGEPVEVPLAHTFVTGQTQLSGKTTTLRAIVERAGRRALAFVTKRGESFEGRRIRPYLPREGEQPITWRLVETILASALGQRSMKYERLWIVNAAKGARSLADVRHNVTRLQEKARGGSQDMYMLLGEYLDLVLPEMRALNASDALDLQPGLNVMDLAGVGQQLQALVIRAALERINHHEAEVLVVLPEAWEFAPRARSAPAKDEAIALARKGAAPKVQNFLLVDSQDIAGVDEVIRRACSVWLLGVQRELNELKRTVQMIPAGVKRPKAEDVAQLELGQFYACWGRHAVKVYVRPAWMNAAQAEQVATGALTLDVASRLSPGGPRWGTRAAAKEDDVNATEAQQLRDDNARLARENDDLRRRLEALEVTGRARPANRPRSDQRHAADRAGAGVGQSREGTARDGGRSAGDGPTRAFTVEESFDNERLYQAFKARLISELPSDSRVMEIVLSRPELRVKVERHVIQVDGKSTRGRIARLIADSFFTKSRTSAEVLDELLRRGANRPSNIELGNELKALCEMGFFTRDNKWYSLVPDMKVNVLEG